MLKKIKWLYVAIFYTILVFVVSLVSFKDVPQPSISMFDKMVHLGIYVVFTIVWFFNLYLDRQWRYDKAVWFAAIFAILVGVLIEYLQGAVTVTRSADVNDMLANVLGTVFAVIFLKLISNRGFKLNK